MWHALQCQLRKPHWKALFFAIFMPQTVMGSITYMMDDITGPFVTVACWRSHQTCAPRRTQTAAVRDLSELARQLLTNSKNLTRNHPKNTLTISLVSSPPPATGCGQRGCMGVALLSLEIKRWRTAGMPMVRMWQLLPSWDALPQQWFPGYQVREKPPVDLLKWMASAKPLANPPPHIPLHPHHHHEFTWHAGKQVDCAIILVEIEQVDMGRYAILTV